MMSSESNMVKLCANLTIDFTANIVKGAKFYNPLIAPVLETLLGLLSNELNDNSGKLDEIGLKLDKLTESYYKTGYDYLNDAFRVTDSRREKWIEAALDKFRTASAVENLLMSAKSLFYVGVCYDLLNEGELSLSYYEKAYTSAWTLCYQLIPSNKIFNDAINTPGFAKRSLSVLYTHSVEFGGRVFQKHQMGETSKKLEGIYETFMKPLAYLLEARGSTLDLLQKSLPQPTKPTKPNKKNPGGKFYFPEDLDIEQLANDIETAYQAQGYQVQQIGNKDHMIVQLKKGRNFEAYIGLQTALSLILKRFSGGVLVMIGQQKWIDKAAVGAVGLLASPILWPLMITAGVGAIRQAKLGNEVLNVVDGLVRQLRPDVQVGIAPVQIMSLIQQQ